MAEPVVVASAAAPYSPRWWVDRLYSQLVTRRDMVEFFNNYYTGNHPLPWLAPQAQGEFKRIMGMTRSNYMGLVCDAVAERVGVEGFRFGPDAAADDETWRIFQANHLDKDSDLAWLEALISGTSYFKVAPNREDRSLPFIYVQHANQAIVEHVAGTNRRQRAAGMEVFDDLVAGDMRCVLYLPVEGALRVFKYRAEKPGDNATLERRHKPDWRPYQDFGETWGGTVPELGVVPLIEVPNNPRLLTGGVSEMWDLTDIQDRVNKTLADRLITQDYGAFPQKWISAWPEEDDDGNALPPIDIGRNRVVTTEVAETNFGQWESAPLDPYSAAKREDVKDIASRSRTPAQYLLGELTNVNGETLKASESGLVSKVKQRRRPWGEALEETMRLARQLAGLAGDQETMMETIWSNPEYRTEGELVDSVVKKLQVGVASLRQAREDVGYSATQIKRLEREDREANVNAMDSMIQRALRPEIGAGSGAAEAATQPPVAS